MSQSVAWVLLVVVGIVTLKFGNTTTSISCKHPA